MKFSVMIFVLYGRQAAAFSSRLTRVVSRPMATAVDSESTQQEESTTKMPDMEEIVSLCKRRGIIFPSSEIYNGYAGFYDYGPLGAELKKNIKDAWWKNFVTQREDVVGVDSSIIHNPTTWKSSGTSNKVFLALYLIRIWNPISYPFVFEILQVTWMDFLIQWLIARKQNSDSVLIKFSTPLSL